MMKINSIDRCLTIIELMSEYPDGIRLTEMSQKLDLNPSSLHHIIHTLIPRNYIIQNPDNKRYSLGFRFLEISRRILDNIDVRKTARAHLEELRRETQETVHLAILRDNKAIYIDKIETPAGLSLSTYVGFATDPHAAAGGKVLLSGLPDKEVRRIYYDRSLRYYGTNTITNLSTLLVELEKIRNQGYAIDDQEYYEGIRCVAAPIRSGQKIVASISVTGSIFTVTMERIQRELKDQVISSAKKISAELG